MHAYISADVDDEWDYAKYIDINVDKWMLNILNQTMNKFWLKYWRTWNSSFK